MQSLSTPRRYVSALDVNPQPRYGTEATHSLSAGQQRPRERGKLRIRGNSRRFGSANRRPKTIGASVRRPLEPNCRVWRPPRPVRPVETSRLSVLRLAEAGGRPREGPRHHRFARQSSRPTCEHDDPRGAAGGPARIHHRLRAWQGGAQRREDRAAPSVLRAASRHRGWSLPLGVSAASRPFFARCGSSLRSALSGGAHSRLGKTMPPSTRQPWKRLKVPFTQRIRRRSFQSHS